MKNARTTTLKSRLRAAAMPAVMLAAALPSCTALAADPATHPLSREHVNLVRVTGQKITDVVYDTQALEVSADKARGIVFIRVRPGWLANGGGDITSAFFNTETENFAVQFLVSAVPSQTVDLVPQARPEQKTADIESRIALAAPLMKLSAGDFVSELKLLVQKSFARDLSADPQAIGTLSAGDEKHFAPLVPPEGSVLWEGFRVREVRAFLTSDKLTETLVLTRVSPKAGVPDAARLAKAVRGVLAVASEIKPAGASALQTEITLIRSRSAAVAGDASFESALVELSGSR